MDRPFFSVVIPTRQRAETLRACLDTCLAQDFDDYEVLVVDNASSPETQAVVEAVGSERIRYLRSDRLLAMSANWELAVAEARGEYVTVVGDDDALMPYGLRELHRLVEEHELPGAVRWSRAVWTWPTIAVPEEANCLALPLTRVVEWLDAREVIADVIAFRVSSEQLPMIYNSVVRRDVIDRLRDRCGSVFPTIYPDVYSGFALGTIAERYLSVEVPMGMAGLGGRSNGVATLMQEEGRSPIAEEFNSLNSSSGYLPHPRVPDLTNVPVHIVDSFEHARDRLFPDDVELDYDRWTMTQRYLATITAVDEAARQSALELIKSSLDDRPELRERVDDEAPLHPPAPVFRFRPERFGFDGSYLRVDTSGLGIEDVAACSRFAMRLLGVDARPVEYGLPHVHRLDMQRATAELRAEAAERRAEDAEHRADRAVAKTRAMRRKLATARSEASLRRVPRRVAHRVAASLRRTRTES